MLTTDERLKSLEAGTTQQSENLHDAATDAEVKEVIDSLRERLRELYTRIIAIQNILNTSREICEEIEADLEAAGRI